MAIIIKKEVNRHWGLSVTSGVTVVAGMVGRFDTTDTTGATATTAVAASANAIGLFLESNVAKGTGLGLNSRSDTNGSDKVSVATNGGWFLIYDDGRGCPYDNSQTYTLGQPLWTNAYGRVTNVATASGITNQIGICTKVPTTATDSLGVKLLV